MNKDRRKRLETIKSDIEKLQAELSELTELQGKIEELKSNFDDAKTALEEIKDEEQEAFDNLSENLQGGDKGSIMQEAIEQMESAGCACENINDHLDAIIEAIENLDQEAQDALDGISNAVDA